MCVLELPLAASSALDGAPDEQVDYLIIGAGVFGASTAYHLSQAYPDKRIVLVDKARPNPSAASSDYNKIIRADYPDHVYAKMALEAIESWTTDPLYKPFFHQCGILFAEEIGMGRDSLASYRTLDCQTRAEVMTLDEGRARFPQLQGADWTDAQEIYFNPESGWGEADAALGALVDATVAGGVEFLEATVLALAMGADRACVGAHVLIKERGLLSTRTVLAREKTILCAGPLTAKLLADTDPEWDDLQVNGRMVAAGAVQCAATYPPTEVPKLAGAPCHFLGMWHTHGEMIPPLNGRIKFNCEVSFLNKTPHPGLKEEISMPPTAESQCIFGDDVPEGLKQEADNVVRRMFGDYIEGLTVESYRMCWDAVSPNQDWIIDHHPHCRNLFIAGAGSFHAWKFLPTIGKYVVQRLFGTLEDGLARKWAWDRSDEGAACEMYIPTRDLKSIGPFNGWPCPTD